MHQLNTRMNSHPLLQRNETEIELAHQRSRSSSSTSKTREAEKFEMAKNKFNEISLQGDDYKLNFMQGSVLHNRKWQFNLGENYQLIDVNVKFDAVCTFHVKLYFKRVLLVQFFFQVLNIS